MNVQTETERTQDMNLTIVEFKDGFVKQEDMYSDDKYESYHSGI